VISKEQVSGFAAVVGLPIDEQRIPLVVENLLRMEQVYQLVAAVELGPEDEIGPEWRP
jgi:hypothetical protein